MSRSPLALSLVAVLVTATSLAVASGYSLQVVGARTYTGYTGYAGSQKGDVGNAGCTECTNIDSALRGITVHEELDTPHMLYLVYAELKSGGATHSKPFPSSDGSGKDHAVTAGADAYISAVQACTNDKGDKSEIKGLRIWETRFSSTGLGTASPTAISFEQPNCSKWTTKVSCAPNEVVDLVTVAYSGNRMQGLRLGCRPVKPH